jgi:hypothetical protein
MDAIILPVVIKEYDNYTECKEHLLSQGCKDLGWINDGISIPKSSTFINAFSNRSGSSCLYVDIIRREFYSVDTGD